jgi:hypothetical protein
LSGDEIVAIDGRLEPYRESEFPRLVESGYRVTSRASRQYNCFAWVAGQDGLLKLYHPLLIRGFLNLIVQDL